MNLNISTSLEFTKERTEKTRAVQGSIATGGGWTWPLKTLALWDADLAQLEGGVTGTLAQKALASDAAFTVKRAALDTRYRTMHARTLQAVGVMRARALQDPEVRDSVDELSARGDSFRAIEDEGEELLAVWKEEFGTAFLPAPGNTYAEFEKLFIGAAGPPAVPSLRVLKNEHKDARVLARKDAGKLSALINRLDDECIAWYKEATAVYPAGTDEGDLIRTEVPTTADYNPGGGETVGGGGGGPTLPPAPTGLDFAQANRGDAVEVTGTLPAGTTLVKIFALLVGASGDPVQVAAAAALPTSFSDLTPGDYEFTATVTVGGLESPHSAPFPLTVA